LSGPSPSRPSSRPALFPSCPSPRLVLILSCPSTHPAFQKELVFSLSFSSSSYFLLFLLFFKLSSPSPVLLQAVFLLIIFFFKLSSRSSVLLQAVFS
jgi:hypothetical protein